MKFLTQSLAYLCIASFAATANADCNTDIMENFGTVQAFGLLFVEEALKAFQTSSEPDYTALQNLCQENAAMDYFTASFTQTCVNGSQEDPPIEMKDIPQCFPSSCTSDEAALKAMYADMNSDEPDANFPGLVCTDTDFSFSGLAEVEEEDMTSGGSFRASIAGSVLMLAVASALL